MGQNFDLTNAYRNKTECIIRKHLKRESASNLSQMSLKELYSKFKEMNLGASYPLLEYVLAKVCDESIEKERKIKLMQTCYMASFMPNTL